MVQFWHCRPGNLNSVLHVPHTMSACWIASRFRGSSLLLLLLLVSVISLFTIFYQILFEFLDNFIFVFSVFLILIQLYVQVFYYYCTFVYYFPTSTSALVCRWILFCCSGSSIYSLAWVSGWTVTDYLFAAGWRLFKYYYQPLNLRLFTVYFTI